MHDETLRGVCVAILVDDGWCHAGLHEPLEALESCGAEVSVISLRRDAVCASTASGWGGAHPVHQCLDDARADDFDALLLPDGVMSPGTLHIQRNAVAFVKAFFDAGKPVAILCHAPWTLIEAGAARGRRIAAWPWMKPDLRRAGAMWIDEQVATDGKLVSGRTREDLPAFNLAMIELFSQTRLAA